MSTFNRFLLFLIVLGVALGGIILAYNLLTGANQPALVTIGTSGKFSASKKQINNGQKFRIRNDNNVNQTVKLASTNETVAEIEGKSISKEISLKKDSQNVLYLASNREQKTTITVGKPATEDKSTTTSNTTNTPQSVTKPVQGTVTTQDKPLPNTGPGDIYLFSLSAFVGLGLYKFSNFFWKKALR